MQIEKVSYAGNPERVTEQAFDCVWVHFQDRKAAEPLESQILQWIDWRMQGQLSRYVLGAKKTAKLTTFLPTQNRIAAPLVALEAPGEPDWEAFGRNCEGMGIKKLLVLCEKAEALTGLEKELKKLGASGVKEVAMGLDAPVGKG